MGSLEGMQPETSPDTVASETAGSLVPLNPDDLITVTRAITEGFVHSLREFQYRSAQSAFSLLLPARILFFLGIGLILGAAVLRAIPKLLNYYSFNDSVASMIIGLMLLLISVFLFCYPAHNEQAKATAVVKSTEKVARGLVARLGATK